MKPRTKLEHRAVAASRYLRPLTPHQTAWGMENLFPHLGYWCSHKVWCSDCGSTFDKPCSGLLRDILDDEATCPHCGQSLKITPSRKRKHTDRRYLTLVTLCGGLQVLRTFEVCRNWRRNENVEYTFNEVVRLFINEQGEHAIMACNRAAFTWTIDKWVYGTMSVKRPSGYQYGNPYLFEGEIYPRRNVMPILKRNGYRADIKDINQFDLMTALLREPHAETLLKSGQRALFEYACVHHWRYSEWASVKIAIRNGYEVTDATMWLDYLRFLKELGLDTRSPRYVCPADLKASHDTMRKRCARKREAEERAEKRRRAIEDESTYQATKARFFGLMITNGSITIRPLQSVSEFAAEGEAMHHCVFDGGYYKRASSLILTARNQADERLETIELDLNDYRVVQSRAAFNGVSEQHDEIVALVNENITQIKKLAAK